MATFYLDPENGNDANDGTSFANRWKTLTNGATTARIAPGDTIRVIASPSPTSVGQSVSWINGAKTITLSTPVTANISTGASLWTAANANVTTSVNTTDRKTQSSSTSIVIGSGFTTGKVAYLDFINPIDYSGYKQASFWIKLSTAINSGVLSLRLCSDNLGNTTVTTINVPAIPIANYWLPITVNVGSAFGSVIRSVALYATIDPGTLTVFLDSIIACKDAVDNDSLTLNSLIGKNSAGEAWWTIQEINDTTISFDSLSNELPTFSRGYYGTEGSATLYKREPISSYNIVTPLLGTVNESGTLGSQIVISGGWDRTNMSSQSGDTWIYQPSVTQITNNQSYTTIDKISFSRCQIPILFGGDDKVGNVLDNCQVLSCDLGLTLNNELTFGTLIAAASSVSVGYSVKGSTLKCYSYSNALALKIYGGVSIDTVLSANNAGPGVVVDGPCYESVIYDLTVINNNVLGLYMYSNASLLIKKYTSSGNAFGSIYIGSYETVDLSIRDTLISETPQVFWSNTSVNYNSRVSLEKYEGVITDIRQWVFGGLITSEAGADRHAAAGIAWKLSPISDVRTVIHPVTLNLGQIYVLANSAVTVKAWMKRTNITIEGRLVCKKSQIAGVTSTQVSSISQGSNIWQEVSISFTPTEAGVVEIEVQAYGSTTESIFIDDLEVTQA
jgi:hypothetical protein